MFDSAIRCRPQIVFSATSNWWQINAYLWLDGPSLRVVPPYRRKTPKFPTAGRRTQRNRFRRQARIPGVNGNSTRFPDMRPPPPTAHDQRPGIPIPFNSRIPDRAISIGDRAFHIDCDGRRRALVLGIAGIPRSETEKIEPGCLRSMIAFARFSWADCVAWSSNCQGGHPLGDQVIDDPVRSFHRRRCSTVPRKVTLVDFKSKLARTKRLSAIQN